MTEEPASDGKVQNWLDSLFAAFNGSPGESGDPSDLKVCEPVPADADDSPGAIESVRGSLIAALIAAIRAVSDERDREEVVDWFANARDTLEGDKPTTEKVTKLYKAIDSQRLAEILANTVKTSLLNYKGSSLPLALKVAIPITVIGLPVFGFQGAGLAAFGSAIGLPVIFLLFLGSAGVATVVEAFVKDRNVRDPLTKLMMAFVAADASRRIEKKLLNALRADALIPQRVAMPEDERLILSTLLSVDPIAFERHVMTFFEDDGYPAAVTAATNDYGVDGYAWHPDGLIIVQCKRYASNNLVGSPDMTQFWGTMEMEKAYRGYFVTTSEFTSQARTVASENPRITLVDGLELVKWHKQGRRTA
ncbi:MAG: restriction endonuclease [Verrucomicrobiaceae bacterium]